MRCFDDFMDIYFLSERTFSADLAPGAAHENLVVHWFGIIEMGLEVLGII